MCRALILSILVTGSIYADKSKKKILCIDIHGVIVQTNSADIWRVLMDSPHKNLIIKTIFKHPIMFAQTIQTARTASKLAEFHMLELVKVLPEFGMVMEEFYALSNGHLNKEFVEVLKNLYNQGYLLYFATNAGPATFDAFCKNNPEIYKLFSGSFRPLPENGYLAKPDQKFFITMRKAVDEKYGSDAQIIFIDDSKINITMAQRALNHTDQAYLFSHSSACKQELIKLGFAFLK